MCDLKTQDIRMGRWHGNLHKFSQQPFWVNWLCFRIGWSPPRLLKLDEFWLLSVRMSHTHDLMMLWIIIRFKMLFLVCIIDLMIKVKCLVWIGAIPNLRFWFTGSHSPLFERLQPKYRKMQVEIQYYRFAGEWSNIMHTVCHSGNRLLDLESEYFVYAHTSHQSFVWIITCMACVHCRDQLSLLFIENESLWFYGITLVFTK